MDRFFIILLSTILFSCKQSGHTPVLKSVSSNTDTIISSPSHDLANKHDTSNQNIYDFMKVVIASQKLDLSYGLEIDPQPNCDLSQDDKTFLNTLLIENKKQGAKVDTDDWRKLSISSNMLERNKCLTKADIKSMLEQKESLATFRWNNSRLGFSQTNDKNWYCFSIPIFSQDKNKVVMMIRSLCPGLCGTGSTVLFVKEKDKWVAKTGEQWIH